jgi:glycosyltransferase involved in cell wall biosynthesis
VPRVLQLFEPPDGGVARHVLDLALGLGEHGWEVELAGSRDAIVWPEVEAAGLRTHVLPFVHGYRDPGSDARVFRRLVPLLRRERYDLVHCHSSKAGASGRVAAALAGSPAVYTPHGFAFKAGHPLLRIAFAAIERGLAPRARRIICVSEDERRLARRMRLGGGDRLRVIHNGCAHVPGVPPDPRLIAHAAGHPLAAAVTVLRPEKGVDVFLDAVPLVLERMPEARLAVVGSGPSEPDLRARAAPLLADERFAFLSFEPPVERHLNAIDVFVLASRREGLPIGPLEAMACGVPQVATAVGGTPEAVTAETGVLVPPSDPDALADGIVALLRDPQRRERAAAASRARHAAEFDLRRTVAATAALYDEVTRPHAGAGAPAARRRQVSVSP